MIPTPSQLIDLYIFRYADIEPDRANSFLADLSVLERKQCSNLSKSRSQEFLVERGQLRQILAKATGSPAEQLEFARSESGKPYLVATSSDIAPVFFNLSHCRELFVCAISPFGEIGVDIEFSQRANKLKRIAKHYFSDEENQFLDSNIDEFDNRFTQLWTVKEAIGKLLGTGINKSFLKNSTCLKQEKFLPNIDWLGIPVVTQSYKQGDHFLSFAVESARLPAFEIHDQGWQEL